MKEKQNQLPSWIRAFLVGGVIGVVGQGFWVLYETLQVPANLMIPALIESMALLGGVLSVFGIYDKIEAFGGMGAAMPMSGLAAGVSAVTAQARKNGASTGASIKAALTAPAYIFGSGVIAALIVNLLRLWI